MSHVDEGTLHALVDNALDASERSAVEAHLASCGDCARRFAEATAMARQVVTLLGALDEPASRITIVAATPVVVASPDAVAQVASVRRRMITLRRVALAASVLLVAGVSYEVGKQRESAPASEAASDRARAGRVAAPMSQVPSIVEGVDSFVAAPAPSVRERPRGGARSESAIVADARADAEGSRNSAPTGAAVATQLAPMQAPVTVSGPMPAQGRVQAPAPTQRLTQTPAEVDLVMDTAAQRREAGSRAADEALQRVQVREQTRAQQGPPAPARMPRIRQQLELASVVVTGVSSPAAANGNAVASAKSTQPKVVALAGYSVSEDSVVTSITRRRYLSPTGTSLELLIVPSASAKQAAGRIGSAEFLVTTENGLSVVRWRAGGMDYSLQGALAPDSLVKLATTLKP